MVVREKIKFNQLNETSSKLLKSKQGTTGGRYWCRVGGKLGQASILNPLCFSLDPARNYFYYLEKQKANQDVSMAYIVEIDANICDLTNEKDLMVAGLPPSLKVIFEKYGEPYFSINTNINPRRKDGRYQPKVLQQVIQSIGSKGLKKNNIRYTH